MIESSKIKINEKEYKFLKPNAIDLIDIEDESVDRNGFNLLKFKKAMLAMVSKDIDIKELVTFTKDTVELLDGTKITPKSIDYEEHYNKVALSDGKRRTFCNLMLENVGLKDKIEIRLLTRDEIINLSTLYLDLYNEEYLDKIVDEIATFCTPPKVAKKISM